MKIRSWGVPLLLLALVTARSFGQTLNLETVYRLLLKVATAPSEVGYTGTVRTVAAGSGFDHSVVVRINHHTSGEDRVTILEPAADAGRVFVHNPHGARPGHRGNGPLSLGLSGVRSRLRSDLALLLSNYTLSAALGRTVAGRTTYRVEIRPKYPDRKSKQLWVDRKTGIVLKSIVVHPVGDVVMTTEFTEVRLTPDAWTLPSSVNQPLRLPKQEALRVSTGTRWIGVIDKAELATLDALEKRERFVLLSPSYLPTGFVMEQVRNFPSPTDSKSAVVHILYSDGLSSISLFLQREEPFWPDRVRRFFFGARHEGGEHHHRDDRGVAVVEGSRNGTRYVLVSDIATQTLRQMAESLSPMGR